jgi:hypothetical protein
MRLSLTSSFVLLFLFFSTHLIGQKTKNRPEKQENVQTRETAIDKEGAAKAEKQAAYVSRSDHHKKLQDKATQKRMKKNLKRSQKHSVGKEIPWYKRIFRRKKAW